MPIARPPQGFDMGSLTEAEKALLAERALFTKGEQGWVVKVGGGWVGTASEPLYDLQCACSECAVSVHACAPAVSIYVCASAVSIHVCASM